MGCRISWNNLLIDDVFIKRSWVKPLTDKKAETVLNGFIEKVNKSKPKPNKLRIDQG